MGQACPTRQRFAVPPAFRTIDRLDGPIAQEPRRPSRDIERAAALWIDHGPDLFLSRGTAEILETELRPLAPLGTRALIDDTLALARRYQRLSGTAEIRFRLERISDDSCRCFHVDTVALRLLCTYAGPGVQWKYHDGETVHETPAGWLTLLKGRLYPGWSMDGAVLHRSPPIAGLAPPVTRLVLTLDHPDACGMGPRQPVSSGR
ncbi:DUF1826 domain-containing protein [Gluconacetobacter sacchari]|uniref:DUF1826 domain-containing protein n=1 Tax=Gluconacetobacter sacchari TaxID=92759 RepID=UPI0039B56AAB